MTESYKAIHIQIFQILGISSLPDGKDIKIQKTTQSACSFLLTENLNDHLKHICTFEGIGRTVLKGIFTPSKNIFLKDIVNEEKDGSLQEKQKNFPKGVFLILEGSTKVTKKDLKIVPIEKQFIFCLNQFGGGYFKKHFSAKFGSILLNVLLSIRENLSLDFKEVGYATFLNKQGSKEKIYCIELTGKGFASVSGPLEENEINFDQLIFDFEKNEKFEGVGTLFINSVNSKTNKKESYFNSWVALEKLIVKIYNKHFHTKWTGDFQTFPPIIGGYFTQNDVLNKEFINMVDKFAIIISYYLKENIFDIKTLEDEFEGFKEIIKVRNEVFHSIGLIDEEPLNFDAIQKLLKKHLIYYSRFLKI